MTDTPPHSPPQEPTSVKKSGLKTVVILGLALIAVMAGALGFLIANLESFRKPLLDKLSSASGLQISIQTLSLSFMPAPSLKCDGLQVRSGSRDLFSAETLLVEPEFMALLKKELRIKRIVFDKPVIKIHSDAPSKKEGLSIPENPRDTLKRHLKNFNLIVNVMQIKNGQAYLIRHNDDPAKAQPIGFSMNLQLRRKDQNRVDVLIEPLNLEIASLRASGSIRSENLLAPEAAIDADFISKPFAISDLKSLASFAPGAWAKQLEQIVSFGTVENISFRLNMPLKAMHNTGLMAQNAKARLEFKIRDTVVKTGSADISIPEIDGTGVLENAVLSHEFHVKVLDGAISANGKTAVIQAQRPEKTAIDSHIKLEQIDLTRLKLPNAEGEFSGTVSGSAQIAGTLDDIGIPEGGIEIRNPAFVRAQSKFQVEKASFKLKNFRREGGTVDFEIDQIALNNIALKNVAGSLHASPEALDLTRCLITPGHGRVDISGQHKIPGKFFSVEFSGKDLQAEDIFKDRIMGPLQFAGKLTGPLHDGKVGRGLDGRASFKSVDGSILNLEIVQVLLQLINLPTVLNESKPGLNYISLGGDFDIKDGIVTTDNLALDGKQLDIFVDADADLESGKLKGEVKAMPLLGRLVMGGQKGGIVQLFFTLEGTLQEPKISFNPAKSALSTPANVLKGIVNIPLSLFESAGEKSANYKQN